MKTRISLIFLFLYALACDNAPEEKSDGGTIRTKAENEFDPAKWSKKEGHDYPYRNDMLKDLMNDQNLKALKKSEIIDLLGQPDRIDSSYLFYMISQERLGFWPLHTKTMVIKLSGDSTVIWVKIHE